jgi:hypothetical protein
LAPNFWLGRAAPASELSADDPVHRVAGAILQEAIGVSVILKGHSV